MPDKAAGEKWGLRLENAGEHLMLGTTSALFRSEVFESRVEDSLKSLDNVEDVGLSAHNEINEVSLAYKSEGAEIVKFGPQNNSKPGTFSAPLVDGPVGDEGNGQEDIAINLSDDSSRDLVQRGVTENGGFVGEQDMVGNPTELVRLSQIPCINLMVDLNNAGAEEGDEDNFLISCFSKMKRSKTQSWW